MALIVTPEQVRVLLDSLEDNLSHEFRENHLQCLAEAGYDTVRKLKGATLADLVETGLSLAAARLILNASAPGAVQPWTIAELFSPFCSKWLHAKQN